MAHHKLHGMLLAATCVAAWPLAAGAACLSDTEAAALVANYLNRKPAANPEGLNDADGACTRAKVNKYLLQQIGGQVVGYKAGLTNPAVQKRFNASAPVYGVLYSPMLLRDGATVDATFGARPLYEADLLVRVRDSLVNRASTPEEVVRHIDQVIPAIELPDLVVEAPGKLNGAAISAINVGARHFVLGQPIPVVPTTPVADALQNMIVIVSGPEGELDRGKGSDVLEHPLNAVIWLARELQKQGLALRKGDLVSVGSFSKLMPPKPGQAIQVRYQGLPGDPVVRVNFK
jgi:2-keto-4-pentenoate hydratase